MGTRVCICSTIHSANTMENAVCWAKSLDVEDRSYQDPCLPSASDHCLAGKIPRSSPSVSNGEEGGDARQKERGHRHTVLTTGARSDHAGGSGQVCCNRTAIRPHLSAGMDRHTTQAKNKARTQRTGMTCPCYHWPTVRKEARIQRITQPWSHPWLSVC